MADLFIDGATLERVNESFKNIEDLLNGPARTMKSVDASGVGPSTLKDRIRDFGDLEVVGRGLPASAGRQSRI